MICRPELERTRRFKFGAQAPHTQSTPPGVFFRPLDKIAAVIETYPRGIAGFRRYLELLATEPEIADDAGAAPPDVLDDDDRLDALEARLEVGEVLLVARHRHGQVQPRQPRKPRRFRNIWLMPQRGRPRHLHPRL